MFSYALLCISRRLIALRCPSALFFLHCLRCTSLPFSFYFLLYALLCPYPFYILFIAPLCPYPISTLPSAFASVLLSVLFLFYVLSAQSSMSFSALLCPSLPFSLFYVLRCLHNVCIDVCINPISLEFQLSFI